MRNHPFATLTVLSLAWVDIANANTDYSRLLTDSIRQAAEVSRAANELGAQTVHDAEAVPVLPSTTTARRVPRESTDAEVMPLVAEPSIRTVQMPADAAPKKDASPMKLELSPVDLFVGESRILGQYDVRRVAVGNGSVLQVELLDNGDLLIIAKQVGSSTVHLWHGDGSRSGFNVHAFAEDPVVRLQSKTMIRLDVRMVEFRKQALEQLGIDWSDSIAGPVAAAAGDVIDNRFFRPDYTDVGSGFDVGVKPFSGYLGIATMLRSRIDLMSVNGDAVTLAEPVLSCANGGEAEFLAGGEIPYPQRDSNGNPTVMFKEYGIRLAISPRADAAGNVQTRLLAEVSQIDNSVNVEGAPGLLTRRTSTEVHGRLGETIIVAGLLSDEQDDSQGGVPGLSRLPVVGGLFSTRTQRRNTRELVLFITPHQAPPLQREAPGRSAGVWARAERRARDARAQLPLME